MIIPKELKSIIVPAILAKDQKDLKSKLDFCIDFLKPQLLQFDIMDGVFTKDKTVVKTSDIKKISKQINCELHLMIDKPEKKIDQWLNCNPQKIAFHFETTDKHLEIIKKIKSQKIKAGLAINPETKISQIKTLISKVDYILILSVKPGKSGQKIITKVLNKIKAIRKIKPSAKISIDGGINFENGPKIYRKGVNQLVMGSAIFENKS